MPEKQERIIAAGLAALLATVLMTVLMRQPEQPVIVSVQTKTPPVAEIGTVPSAAAKATAIPETVPSVSASRTDQSKNEVLQCTTPDYNLNTADEAALQEVSGVGAVTAAAITAYRESAGGFTRRSQLLEIPGIGEALAARIMERFYIPDEQPDPEPPQDAGTPEIESAPAEPQEQEIQMLNLNTAERRDLLRLPEMTEELADAILSMREQLGGYQNLHELLLVDGLSPEYFEHTLRLYTYI